MADTTVRHLTQGQIEKIARILGDTQSGLKGSEIGFMLNSCNIEDVSATITKWNRLYNAFADRHNTTSADNFILKFIAKALEPSRFLGDVGRFHYLTSQINSVLSFQGLEYRQDGIFYNVKAAKDLTEAQFRVSRLKKAIEERNLHPILLEYCKTELLNDNYFHAVLESVKGIASTIRSRTSLVDDGADLIKAAFGGEVPRIKINNFHLETEKSEQRGFLNLLIGIFGTFRNPTAHAAKIEWDLDEQDALDIFGIVSYALRRIEESN